MPSSKPFLSATPRALPLRTGVAAVAVLALVTLLALLTPGPAFAADDAGGERTGARGTLNYEGEPLRGVRVVLEQPPGTTVAEALTDERGAWTVVAPQPGNYRVVIDEATLPEGVTARETGGAAREVTLREGQTANLFFPLGTGERKVQGTASRALGLGVDGLRFGLLLALAAVGLSLIFGTTGLTNFAHGELVTLGAIVALYFNTSAGLHLIPAAILTVVVCGILGALLDTGFWRVLRRRGTGLIAMMIVSIGLAILVRYVYLFLIGGSTRTYADYTAQPSLDLGPIALAPKDLMSMALAAGVLLATGLALLYTRIGKATRAVADNPSLAAASGIDVDRVIVIVWAAGAAMAGLAGVLLGISQQVNWQMGFEILLLIFAGVTLGGLGTAFGALVGSLVVGIFLQLSTLIIPSELKNVGALAVLIVILLVRPQGILGRAERVG